MASIELKNAEKWFGHDQVIKGINLTIKKGEFVVFVGPSGCGKSTIWQVLSHAYNKARERHGEAAKHYHNMSIHIMNAKSMPRKQLLGHITHEQNIIIPT